MKKQYIIPIMIPDNEYPYNGIYYMKKEDKTKKTKEEITKVIESHLKKVKDAEEIEIAFLGKSFTSMEEEEQEKLLEIANNYIKEKKVDRIRISAKPNEITRETLKKLKRNNVKTIELEAISCNDYILKCAQKQYKYNEIKKASKMIKRRGIELGCQMMVGLPESTRIDEINTAKEIIKLKPKVVRIHPIFVIKGTKLEKEYKKGNYQALTVVQGVEICKELIRAFADKDIEVIRIGFQDAEKTEENQEEGIIAGPFHPAFRELVETAMWYDAIVSKIKKLNVKVKEVEVKVNPIDVENVIGLKNENVLKLKETYDVDLIVKSDEKIKQGKSSIEIIKTYNDFLKV